MIVGFEFIYTIRLIEVDVIQVLVSYSSDLQGTITYKNRHQTMLLIVAVVCIFYTLQLQQFVCEH